MLRPSASILRRERVTVNRLRNRRANVLAVRTQRSFASGATETAETRPFRRVSDQPVTGAAHGFDALGAEGLVVEGRDLPADEAALGALLDRDGVVVSRVTPEDKLRIAKAPGAVSSALVTVTWSKYGAAASRARSSGTPG